MSRMSLAAAAIAVAGIAVPAFAAEPIGPGTVVQGDTPFSDRGFLLFDSSLGVLQSVRLDVTPNFRRIFQVIVPGQVESAAISWNASNEQFCRYGACTSLVASGAADVPLIYSTGLFGGSSYAYVSVDFSGATVVSSYLNPAQFINPPFPGFRRFLTLPDPGLYDETLSDIFQIVGDGFVRNATTSFCANSIRGCDLSYYSLTYSYAPGGLPEPATWAMMMLGFGAMGAALRRRPKLKTTVRYA